MPDFEYFKPYEGDKPYIFVSYAHANDAEVLPIISDMHRRGYNIWYDEGIEVGSEWQECIAAHLADAHLVIAFISDAYIASDNCRREMHYALSKRIKTINVFLENARLTPGMEMQIGNIFALMKYSFPSEKFFYDKLYSAPLLNSEDFSDADSAVEPVNATRHIPEKELKKQQKRRKKDAKILKKAQRKEEKENRSPEELAAAKKKRRKIITLISALIIVGCIIAAFIVGYFTGYIERLFTPTAEIAELDPSTVAEFSDPTLEAAARLYTGITEGDITVGDLKGLTELYIYGDGICSFVPYANDIKVASVASDTAIVNDPQGYEHSVARGSVKDLSDLAYFTDLKILHLEFQTLNSLATLPACGIETLNLDSCRLASLEGIGNLPNLTSLSADSNPISDLGDLNKCLELKSISAIGSSCTDFNVFKPLLKIESIAFSNCTLGSVAQALDHSSLKSVTLTDCDLTGSFFKSFDRERGIEYLNISGSKLDSLSGIDDFTGLKTLCINGSTGIDDWSALSVLTSLDELYADAVQAQSIGEIAAEVIVVPNL